MIKKTVYFYYLIKFGDGKTYWYRFGSGAFKVGTSVIVPVTNNGLWQIGTVENVGKYTVENLPKPIVSTMGIVGKAGIFAKRKIKLHNAVIQKSPNAPIDISKSSVETANGVIEYITCKRERQFLMEENENGEQRVIIENYPVASERDVPKEALIRLKNLLNQRRELEQAKREMEIQQWEAEKAERDLEFERENEFMELMEDLDEYN